MKSRLIPAAAALVFALPAAAAPGNNFIDGYYVANTLGTNAPEPIDDEVDGDGAGVRGAIELLPDLFLTGEYQSVDYEEDGLPDFQLDQFRIGGGFGAGVGNGGGLYGRLEYVSIDDDDDSDDDEENGIGGDIGFALPLSKMLRIYAEAGYVSLDTLDGPEFTVGVNLWLAQNFGLFADYRGLYLENDDGDDQRDLEDIRVGVRFYF